MALQKRQNYTSGKQITGCQVLGQTGLTAKVTGFFFVMTVVTVTEIYEYGKIHISVPFKKAKFTINFKNEKGKKI